MARKVLTAAPSCHGAGSPLDAVAAGAPVVALVGAPNAGKSTLFNALTGANVKMGNWPGTSVEVARGSWRIPGGRALTVCDLPGSYSLDPVSPDEELTRELLIGRDPDERPDVVLVAVDAANIARGLYLAAQVAEHPYRLIVVLTKSDVAAAGGVEYDVDTLSRSLGLPVVAVDPRRRELAGLAEAVTASLEQPPRTARALPPECGDELARADARFAWVDAAVSAATVRNEPRVTLTERVDRLALHPVAGPLVFLFAMWCVFQVTTTVAAPLQDGLDAFFSGPVSAAAESVLPDVDWLRGLVVDGLIGGVGMVLTFVPLMALMFLCLAVLEDSGYMARAAVVADRLMRTIGLPGKAFIPLIVGFGCNVPAISATRVLADPRQRLMTALLVPFTSCSARLTVYVMLAATFFPRHSGTVVFAMYVISILLVVAAGLAMRTTLWRRMGSDPLVIDLPTYQWPTPRLALTVMWARLRGFLETAGKIIVATVVVVWALQSTPAQPGAAFGEVAPEDSVYGSVAGAIAPVFEPAGFGSWSLTGPLITGFVAKEAVISSWAQTYSLEDPSGLAAADQGSSALAARVREDFAAASGGHPIAAVWAFMVFLLAYTPCVATLAAQRREIGLRWTLAGLCAQLATAWLLAVAVFNVLKVVL
ncbi:ferrous iron transport protein B [Corynebacterium liangguodongii]|uniref:Ferrous iron transport protein B n=1 Tax=Corynebacterium liangguodongii TaxID=2079535 RepID=A0A2S0WCB6_9CORY|nr:ferrous iron transport protein B [Corynebacterium liangguodongii]AWB83322.1 ferrous iron transport protein B [Corynebacterium liangguodongii]PWC00588.1 ferrous iron transport protein B [Corynebacterium liangguodongii]